MELPACFHLPTEVKRTLPVQSLPTAKIGAQPLTTMLPMASGETAFQEVWMSLVKE